MPEFKEFNFHGLEPKDVESKWLIMLRFEKKQIIKKETNLANDHEAERTCNLSLYECSFKFSSSQMQRIIDDVLEV